MLLSRWLWTLFSHLHARGSRSRCVGPVFPLSFPGRVIPTISAKQPHLDLHDSKRWGYCRLLDDLPESQPPRPRRAMSGPFCLSRDLSRDESELQETQPPIYLVSVLGEFCKAAFLTSF
jgi:hypothetical protein